MKFHKPAAVVACVCLLAPYGFALVRTQSVPLPDSLVDDYLIQLQQRVPPKVSVATPMDFRGFVVDPEATSPRAQVGRGYDQGYVSSDIGQNTRYTNATLQEGPPSLPPADPVRAAAKDYLGQAVAPSAMQQERNAVSIVVKGERVSKDFSGEFAAVMQLLFEGKTGKAKVIADHFRSRLGKAHPLSEVSDLLGTANQKAKGGLPSMGSVFFQTPEENIRIKINGKVLDRAGPSAVLTANKTLHVEVLEPGSNKAAKFDVAVSPGQQSLIRIADDLRSVTGDGQAIKAVPISASVFCFEGEMGRKATFKVPGGSYVIVLTPPQNVTYRWRIIRSGKTTYTSSNQMTEDGQRQKRVTLMRGETFEVEIDCLAGTGQFTIEVRKDSS